MEHSFILFFFFCNEMCFRSNQSRPNLVVTKCLHAPEQRKERSKAGQARKWAASAWPSTGSVCHVLRSNNNRLIGDQPVLFTYASTLLVCLAISCRNKWRLVSRARPDVAMIAVQHHVEDQSRVFPSLAFIYLHIHSDRPLGIDGLVTGSGWHAQTVPAPSLPLAAILNCRIIPKKSVGFWLLCAKKCKSAFSSYRFILKSGI